VGPGGLQGSAGPTALLYLMQGPVSYRAVAVAAPQFVESKTRQSGSMESETRKFVRKLQRLLHFLRLQGPFASNTANRLSSPAFTTALSPYK
jgi:hypothetical protein